MDEGRRINGHLHINIGRATPTVHRGVESDIMESWNRVIAKEISAGEFKVRMERERIYLYGCFASDILV